jgi:two-component system KDP operon response regulator KdpE
LARVLVVDDDPQFRRVMRVALAASGYEISEAADGLRALDELRAQAMDVVLLDWRMPVMDGEATCRAIRAGSSVPIIVVTASDRVENARASGAGDILHKPVNVETLLERIETALGATGTRQRDTDVR